MWISKQTEMTQVSELCRMLAQDRPFIIEPDGSMKTFATCKDRKITLGEMQHAVGGYIEICRCPSVVKIDGADVATSGWEVIIDEEGCLKDEREPNRLATSLCDVYLCGHMIMGKALVVPKRMI